MRFYNDALEMIKEIERDLAEMGIEYQSYSVQDKIVKNDPDYLTKELIGYSYRLNAQDSKFTNLEEMLRYKKDANYAKWVQEESKDRIHRLTQKNPGFAWRIREDFWKKYLRNGRFAYTYAERWQEQLSYIIQELSFNPETRQAIMTMYDRHQDMMNWRGLDRVPCSLTYHFLIRQEKLYVIYSQRSCDFINFFQSDVYCTIYLQDYLCELLQIKPGAFIHHVNSLHAFKKDLEGVF